jgi:aspartate kinase
MLELASLGAGVMHSRSIEFGKKFNVPIHVRSSFSDVPGSMIMDRGETDNLAVSGAALTRDEARISILDVPDVPGTIYKIFSPIAERAITVDMIVQNVVDDGTAVISFTVPKNELAETLDAVVPAIQSFGGNLTDVDEHVSKVSVVGLGMATQVGVANRMFGALGRADINLQMITTSEIKISALVARDQALKALRTVHQEFELDCRRTQPVISGAARPISRKKINAVDVIDRLQEVGMESIVIHDIYIDESQSRITIRRVPNRPGVAALIFDRVAREGIFVDMIVQSHSDLQFADISFTVPKSQFDHALAVTRAISQTFNSAPVLHKRAITKLSVSGVGLRSHTGVAIGMFRALGEAAINVDLINTSEVRVNVVVDGSQGIAGLECLRHEFRNAIR